MTRFLMFVRPCKLMISYVYIKSILELQNVAKGDFLKMKYHVNIVVFGLKSIRY